MVLGITGYTSREEEEVVLGIPGYTSEGRGKCGVRNSRMDVRDKRKKWCLEYQDKRRREEEGVVLGIPKYTSEEGGRICVNITRIHVKERRKG